MKAKQCRPIRILLSCFNPLSAFAESSVYTDDPIAYNHHQEAAALLRRFHLTVEEQGGMKMPGFKDSAAVNPV
ncbi:MAG: hypothetical protein KJP04_06965 [Arenicella sp.]|nr:hypothetical protein [Arenicella sp.]